MNNEQETLLRAFLKALPLRTIQNLLEKKGRKNSFMLSELYEVFLALFSDSQELIKAETTDVFVLKDSPVTMRFVRVAGGENWDVVIDVSEFTTLEDIKKAWREITAYRNALIKFQGTNKRTILNYYSNKNKGGMSYSQVARDVNYECLLNIALASLSPDDSLNYFVNVVFGAELLLEEFGMKPNDSSEWCKDGLHQIIERRLPWSPEHGPVDWMRARDALRYWEHWKDKNGIDDDMVPDWEPLSEKSDKKYEVKRAIKLLEGLEKIG